MYYKQNIIPKNLEANIIKKGDWIDKNFRLSFFKNYFENNNYCSVDQCLEQTRGKLGEEIEVSEKIKSEIQAAKTSVNITLKNKEDIIELINNIQDKNNNKIAYSYILDSKNK